MQGFILVVFRVSRLPKHDARRTNIRGSLDASSIDLIVITDAFMAPCYTCAAGENTLLRHLAFDLSWA